MKTMKILSVDAWAGDEPGSWDWNQWFHVGDISTKDFDKMKSNREYIKYFRDEGYITDYSKGKVGIDDDGYNIVLIEKGTRRPLYAIEYGAVEFDLADIDPPEIKNPVHRKAKIRINTPTGSKFITLIQNGAVVEFQNGGPTEEGFHWEMSRYYFEGTKIYCEDITESMDCDGELHTRNMYYSEIPTKKNGYRPEWKLRDSRQRDFAAEKAGY